MARNRSTDSSAEVSGGESFLDIVANIVGILILLVLIVGVRISTVPLSSDDGAASPSEPLLTAAMVNEQADAAQILGRDVAQLASRAGYLQAVAADRDRERNELATYMAAVEEELTNQKSRLSAEDGKRMQVRAELTSVKFELDRLDKRKIGLLTSEVAPVRVVHTPTPIVRKSSKNSMHLRVEGGKVDVVPFEQLIDQVKRNAKDVLRSANAHGGVARLGRIGNYECFFTAIVERKTVSAGPVLVMHQEGEFRPTVPLPGMAISQAIQPGSPFMDLLRSNPPTKSVVTLWMYNDSAADSKQLHDMLRERGYAIDSRFLPTGAHIGFASNGTSTQTQ